MTSIASLSLPTFVDLMRCSCCSTHSIKYLARLRNQACRQLVLQYIFAHLQRLVFSWVNLLASYLYQSHNASILVVIQRRFIREDELREPHAQGVVYRTPSLSPLVFILSLRTSSSLCTSSAGQLADLHLQRSVARTPDPRQQV